MLGVGLGDHLTQKADGDELYTKNQEQYPDVEEGTVGQPDDLHQTENHEVQRNAESSQREDQTDETEKMKRTLGVPAEEHDGDEVQKSLEESREAVLGLS